MFVGFFSNLKLLTLISFYNKIFHSGSRTLILIIEMFIPVKMISEQKYRHRRSKRIENYWEKNNKKEALLIRTKSSQLSYEAVIVHGVSACC